MKKIIIAAVLLASVGLLLSAQTSAEQQQKLSTSTGVDATRVGIDTAQQKLKEVSISKFEDAGFWEVAIPSDQGLITHRRIEGAPAAKTPVADEAAAGITDDDKYILGVKVDFLRRGATTFSIEPVRPLPIEGIVKTVSVWVIGRNYKHNLKLLIEDFFGRRAEINMGSLNFSGWKKLQVSIPPHIVQRDFHYNNNMGIKILGFVVDCDISETLGSYYIYFDDLRATTDLFAEESRDKDDVPDTW